MKKKPVQKSVTKSKAKAVVDVIDLTQDDDNNKPRSPKLATMIKFAVMLKSRAKRARKQKEIRKKELLEKKCNNIEKYVNIDLGINIIGTSQPKMGDSFNFSECFEILHRYRIKLYITFNELNYTADTKLEKDAFEKSCIETGCKFVSIPVQDYTTASPQQLVEFWELLDNFHKNKKNAKDNVLMHCTAGHGRTGFMITSYIWYKKIKEDKSFAPIDIASILEDNSLPEYKKYETIKKHKIIQFLMDEIKKYSIDSYKEVFQESHNTSLFIDRMQAFINAYDNLTSSSSSSSKKVLPPPASSSKKSKSITASSFSSKKSVKKGSSSKKNSPPPSFSYTLLSCKRDIMY
jgi:hypothetical protein